MYTHISYLRISDECEWEGQRYFIYDNNNRWFDGQNKWKKFQILRESDKESKGAAAITKNELVLYLKFFRLKRQHM